MILRSSIALLLYIIANYVAHTVRAGGSSTPRNLVNLYSGQDNAKADSHEQQFPNNYSRELKTNPSSSSLSADYDYLEAKAGHLNIQNCKGRSKFNATRGFLADGPGLYQMNMQCSWIIDSGKDNATIRIQVHQFSTECNYDFLYIFDGDTVYSPLVAALSGDMKDFSMTFADGKTLANTKISTSNNHNSSAPNIPFEIKMSSGKAFIYFHSDTAQTMNGFHVTYTIDACPLDCSLDKGLCNYDSLTCECLPGYFGNGCQYISCPNNCTSPQHGTCDRNSSCSCNNGYYGPDCSMRLDANQLWLMQPEDVAQKPRAFHKSALINDTLWVVGGLTNLLGNTNFGIFKNKKTTIVSSFNMQTLKWSRSKQIEGITGIDHLAEVSGHSIAIKDSNIYIYGGLAMNYTILNTLSVLDTKSVDLYTISSKERLLSEQEKFVLPVAIVGHSATIVGDDMYIFFGYSNIFGYLHFVQKYNIRNETWSIVEQKGSSVTGCIGHSTNYDPVTRLIYLYGGYNMQRLLTLYSFEPATGTWRSLQPAPTPRYYHSSVIVDRQLVILGGNSYNTSHQVEQCYQRTSLTYDLDCRKLTTSDLASAKSNVGCDRKCWHVTDDLQPGVLKRHGLSVSSTTELADSGTIESEAVRGAKLVLFGGFSGLLLNDLRLMQIGECGSITDEQNCYKPKLGIKCYWNLFESKCENLNETFLNSTAKTNGSTGQNCSWDEISKLRETCESRLTCNDCLHTDYGCVWCGSIPQCRYSSCKPKLSDPRHEIDERLIIIEAESCNRVESVAKNPLVDFGFRIRPNKDLTEIQDSIEAIDCKKTDNCFYCQAKAKCKWTMDSCSSNSPHAITPYSTLGVLPRQNEELNDVYGNNGNNYPIALPSSSNHPDIISKLITEAMASSSLGKHSCETPCFSRNSCEGCISSKCIWCSSSEQCLESSAYFAYHQMGQCMHYVANIYKCPVATCSDIEICDKCLENPKCGWLNDISNMGKGKCIEGTSSGPALRINVGDNSSIQLSWDRVLPNWYYTNCPLCQCNGHTSCEPNSSTCSQPCLGHTEGAYCERCKSGYYGSPINGGFCKPCRCNGHAQNCHRETGKCYCSTKGIIGHHCQTCDDQNHYFGDAFESGNGTCYYNLTTDYQYTFNMSKLEDHSYSDINFMNIPVRWDTDVDFTIACSRPALVNISTGINYLTRKPLQSQLECGSFRLRLTPELSPLTGTVLSYYVHVHKFQTPFVLQVAFSQHRAIFLPQVFFTFSSCFLFFFVLSGVLWKLKIEYDSYVRRQRQYIEMEQMASRPFSTIFLDLSKSSSRKGSIPGPEPTPVSFEPCFASNVGVLSLFVQLPGRPSLAIGSALVSLNDDDNSPNNVQQEKQQTNTSV